MWVEESDLQHADPSVRLQRNAKGRIVRAWIGDKRASAYPSNAGNCYRQELPSGHVYALTGVRA